MKQVTDQVLLLGRRSNSINISKCIPTIFNRGLPEIRCVSMRSLRIHEIERQRDQHLILFLK